jgi:hypothetical protein
MTSTLFLTAQLGFFALSVIAYYFLLREIIHGIRLTSWDESRKKRAKNLTILIPSIFAVFVTGWSISGVMGQFENFPFNFMPVLIVPLIIILWLTFSSSFLEVLKNIPQQNLVRLQTFRVIVEILLWILFIDGLLPGQMSFEGRNFDILAGLTAPIIVWLINSGKISRPGLIMWNVACLGLLINIVTIAIVSTPSPVRIFMNEPANTIVTVFPISFLPGLLVPLAYMLHCFSLRQLLKTSPTSLAHSNR